MSTSTRSPSPVPSLRCAVYTRKSNEEGLEQAFNSLDAQREACEAYIRSQRHAGWRLLSTDYSDGGYSGGNLQRPALQRLLRDVGQGEVDIIVVYKIDRLTRSLADFAKIVETLDAAGASFVSVTQQFNTTSSMGRLTLNVLLSFAQFEREVTGERIRDKIAAAKRKGLWMGGRVPLGYQVQAGCLQVQELEAAQVRHIFDTYLKAGSVTGLQRELVRQGVRSRWRAQRNGKAEPGECAYSRGALYRMLQNPLYAGLLRSGGEYHPGQHAGIVSREQWKKVQARLQAQKPARSSHGSVAGSGALAGLLETGDGQAFHSHSARRGTKLYSYYVLYAARHRVGEDRVGKSGKTRLSLPAYPLEQLVWSRLLSFFKDPGALMDRLSFPADSASTAEQLVRGSTCLSQQWLAAGLSSLGEQLRQLGGKVVLQPDGVQIRLLRSALRCTLRQAATGLSQEEGEWAHAGEDSFSLQLPARLKSCGRETRLVIGDPAAPRSTRRRRTPGDPHRCLRP